MNIHLWVKASHTYYWETLAPSSKDLVEMIRREKTKGIYSLDLRGNTMRQ